MADPSVLLCKDCRWFKRSWLGVRFSTCHAPERSPDTLIAGSFCGSVRYCGCERIDYETIPTCGRAGRYFQQRSPTLLKRLLIFARSTLSEKGE